MVEPFEKLRILGPATCYEPAEEEGVGGPPAKGGAMDDLSGCVHYAAMPGGKRIALLKTLLSSACERDCFYCPFRAGRDFHRVTFAPDELARLFLQFQRRGVAEGIFLSSAVAGGGPHTQDRLIATAQALRRQGFRGYLHLKIMPGAEREQVEAAMALADRVSVNLEAPNDRRLSGLAPHKAFFEELLQRLHWIGELRCREPEVPRPSFTTQFVVGAAGESDREILTTTGSLYRDLGLARAYFKSFSPVPGTPLEDHPPTPPIRERRLYQSSFLLRDYGFREEELPYGADGNLPSEEDPKLAWARRHLARSPVELNLADREALLRVPGIGPKGAERVLEARSLGRLREPGDLRSLGIAAERAAPFILLDGRRPAYQLPLWPDQV